MQIEHDGPRVGDRRSVSSRARDLFLKVLAIAAGAALFAGAFIVSIVFFAVTFAVVLVVGGFLWWRTRHLRKQLRQRFDGQPGQRIDERDVIEGTVLKSE